MMQLIPAIDIMNGQVVRLTKGNPTRQKQYHTDPFTLAMTLQRLGAKRVHIIDLDAALGRGSNRVLILRIIQQLEIPVQVGGGIRSTGNARNLLEDGVDRVILGSMAINDPDQAMELLEEYGAERIVIALDHMNGRIRIDGWQESTDKTLENSLNRFTEMGFTRFFVTNIQTDGTLQGPDVDTLSKISSKAKIIASGGVSNLEDLMALAESGVESIVVGKALLENRFSLQDALAVLEGL